MLIAFRTFCMSRPLTAATVVVTTVSLVLMATLDRPVTELLYRELNPRELEFWRHVSDTGRSVYYLALFLVMFIAGRALFLWSAPQPVARRYAEVARFGLFGLASYALSGTIVQTLKYTVGRYRPKHLIGDGDFGFAWITGNASYNSFPSGHSQSAFTAACVLSVLFPRAAWLFLSLAAIVAVSRVLGGAHFVSDALFGSYVGFVSVLIVQRTWFADLKPALPRSVRFAT